MYPATQANSAFCFGQDGESVPAVAVQFGREGNCVWRHTVHVSHTQWYVHLRLSVLRYRDEHSTPPTFLCET